MQPIIDYILNNKEWIFSGVGVFAISGTFWFIYHLLFRNSPGHDKESARLSEHQGGGSNSAPNVVPTSWQGIVPPQSKYRFVKKTSDSIPLGLQSFSFEYGPHGHAAALTLKGAIVRAEIQFTCRISNPYKALFGANEYALNVLPPRFLRQEVFWKVTRLQNCVRAGKKLRAPLCPSCRRSLKNLEYSWNQ